MKFRLPETLLTLSLVVAPHADASSPIRFHAMEVNFEGGRHNPYEVGDSSDIWIGDRDLKVESVQTVYTNPGDFVLKSEERHKYCSPWFKKQKAELKASGKLPIWMHANPQKREIAEGFGIADTYENDLVCKISYVDQRMYDTSVFPMLSDAFMEKCFDSELRLFKLDTRFDVRGDKLQFVINAQVVTRLSGPNINTRSMEPSEFLIHANGEVVGLRIPLAYENYMFEKGEAAIEVYEKPIPGSFVIGDRFVNESRFVMQKIALERFEKSSSWRGGTYEPHPQAGIPKPEVYFEQVECPAVFTYSPK